MEAQKTRAQMDARYTWKLEDIFPSDSAWEAEYAALAPCIAQAASFAGKLETALPEALPALEEAEHRKKEEAAKGGKSYDIDELERLSFFNLPEEL